MRGALPYGRRSVTCPSSDSLSERGLPIGEQRHRERDVYAVEAIYLPAQIGAVSPNDIAALGPETLLCLVEEFRPVGLIHCRGCLGQEESYSSSFHWLKLYGELPPVYMTAEAIYGRLMR